MLTPPTIASVDGVTVEFNWDDWNQLVDYGNGPVAGYRLYYGLPDNSLTTYEDFPVSNGSISDLEIETSYNFAVSVLRLVDGVTFPGKQTNVVSGKTQCSGEYIILIYIISSHIICNILTT